jgi:hypothetical protein
VLAASENFGLSARDPMKIHPKELSEISYWYSEIMNTKPILEFDSDLKPISFNLQPMVAPDAIELEGENYKNLVINSTELEFKKGP